MNLPQKSYLGFFEGLSDWLSTGSVSDYLLCQVHGEDLPILVSTQNYNHGAIIKILGNQEGMAVHTFNPKLRKQRPAELLSLRLIWAACTARQQTRWMDRKEPG